ncbi:hypothetical protein ACQYAD_08725 [Neobacillus sp. SM06]|uniref:hypothetical protein n=1 Tax=Neobacillus sp. SM06 TaxID=3422492 RepID=UPI003D2AD079
MGKWNEQSAPNNNLPAQTIRTSKLIGNHAFSEELADGGERDQNIKLQARKKK